MDFERENLDQGSRDPKDLLEGQGQGVRDEEKGNSCWTWILIFVLSLISIIPFY